MKNLLFTLFVVVFILVSCQNSTEKQKLVIDENSNNSFELIQIQFGPVFMTSSMITADLKTKKVLFQRIGERDKILYAPPWTGDENRHVFSPSTSYFIIDENNYNFLHDSILMQFNDIDFRDTSLDAHDGIWTSITITNSQNNIKDMELLNAKTDKQLQLIYFLLDICIKQETDSLNLDYLEELKDYY